MTKANLALTAAALVLGLGCLLLFRGLSTERSRVHALEEQVAQLQRDLKHPQPPAANLETAPAAQPPALAVAAQPVAPPPAPATKPVPTGDPAERARVRKILADPALQAAEHTMQLMELQSDHPQLASELGWSKEEVAGFLDLLAEQRLRESAVEMKQGAVEDYQQRLSALYERQEQERREFLGEQRFQAWNEYVRSARARALVTELRTQLATTISPLREEQIKPLVKTLAAEQQRHWAQRMENYGDAQWTDETPVAERVAYMERRGELIEQSAARSKEAGALYLDPAQRRTLDALLERDIKRARAELESMRAFWEAEERQKTASGSH
jgi:hypothetical protein